MNKLISVAAVSFLLLIVANNMSYAQPVIATSYLIHQLKQTPGVGKLSYEVTLKKGDAMSMMAIAYKAGAPANTIHFCTVKDTERCKYALNKDFFEITNGSQNGKFLRIIKIKKDVEGRFWVYNDNGQFYIGFKVKRKGPLETFPLLTTDTIESFFHTLNGNIKKVFSQLNQLNSYIMTVSNRYRYTIQPKAILSKSGWVIMEKCNKCVSSRDSLILMHANWLGKVDWANIYYYKNTGGYSLKWADVAEAKDGYVILATFLKYKFGYSKSRSYIMILNKNTGKIEKVEKVNKDDVFLKGIANLGNGLILYGIKSGYYKIPSTGVLVKMNDSSIEWGRYLYEKSWGPNGRSVDCWYESIINMGSIALVHAKCGENTIEYMIDETGKVTKKSEYKHTRKINPIFTIGQANDINLSDATNEAAYNKYSISFVSIVPIPIVPMPSWCILSPCLFSFRKTFLFWGWG